MLAAALMLTACQQADTTDSAGEPDATASASPTGSGAGPSSGSGEGGDAETTDAEVSASALPDHLQPPTNETTPVQGQELQYPEYAANQGRPSQPSQLGSYQGQAAQAPANHVAPSAVQIVQRQSAVPATRSSSATLIDRSVSAGTASWAGPAPSEVGYHDGTSVYKSVTKPYDYTEGYHFLMKHLPTR